MDNVQVMTSPEPQRKRTKREDAPLPGPRSLFRNKIRKPVTLTLTQEHHEKVNRAKCRLGLTRADTIALLIDQYADSVQRPVEPGEVRGAA